MYNPPRASERIGIWTNDHETLSSIWVRYCLESGRWSEIICLNLDAANAACACADDNDFVLPAKRIALIVRSVETEARLVAICRVRSGGRRSRSRHHLLIAEQILMAEIYGLDRRTQNGNLLICHDRSRAEVPSCCTVLAEFFVRERVRMTSLASNNPFEVEQTTFQPTNKRYL